MTYYESFLELAKNEDDLKFLMEESAKIAVYLDNSHDRIVIRRNDVISGQSI